MGQGQRRKGEENLSGPFSWILLVRTEEDALNWPSIKINSPPRCERRRNLIVERAFIERVKVARNVTRLKSLYGCLDYGSLKSNYDRSI